MRVTTTAGALLCSRRPSRRRESELHGAELLDELRRAFDRFTEYAISPAQKERRQVMQQTHAAHEHLRAPGAQWGVRGEGDRAFGRAPAHHAREVEVVLHDDRCGLLARGEQ